MKKCIRPGFISASGPGSSDIFISPTCVGTSAVDTSLSKADNSSVVATLLPSVVNSLIIPSLKYIKEESKRGSNNPKYQNYNMYRH